MKQAARRYVPRNLVHREATSARHKSKELLFTKLELAMMANGIVEVCSKMA
jgi:hypothetical protein